MSSFVSRACLRLSFASLLFAFCVGAPAVAAPGECQNAAKATFAGCTTACADAACKKECARTQKTELAACAKPAAAAKAGPFKGAGTAASPFEVGTSVKATTLRLGDDRRELHFVLQARKDGNLRFYLTDFTSPIELAFQGEGGKKFPPTQFIKAPDYPPYARYEVEEGQRYAYTIIAVGGPTSVTLRTALDENCRLNNQFFSLPFGGTCVDQE